MVQTSLIQPRGRRTIRRPQHRWQIRVKPYVIQPICIAPVLPGETMRNMMFQARVVTDPIENPLVGWWQEYYWFYVKHRDLNIRDKCESMVLDPSYDIEGGGGGAEGEAANANYYHYGTSVINWGKHCLQRVVEEYFRNEGEAWDVVTIDNMPVASIGFESGIQSAVENTDWDALDQTVTHTVGTPDTAEASDIELALQQWQFLRQYNLTDKSYEDYLRDYGVRVGRTELHKPELIRFVREWSYPTNTIDPSSGAPTSAVSWSISERADKDRFFSEPGWIFGVTLTRPKVYLANQAGNLADMMNNVYTWLPSLLTNDYRTAFREYASGAGPLQGITDGYWIDVRDLLIYGDQFVNFDVDADNTGASIALPTALMEKRYPVETSVDKLFIDDLGASTLWYVRQDGVAHFSIATQQRDQSPVANAAA